MKSTTIKTTCPYCGVGCGVDATTEVKALEAETSVTTSTTKPASKSASKSAIKSTTTVSTVCGDNQHPANFGSLCVKGSALHETAESPHRILKPIVDDQEVSWDKALDTVAEKFQSCVKEHGPDSVAFYLSGQLLTEDYYVANKLMKGFIGSANVDTNSRLCMASAVVGYKRAFGADAVPCSYEDLEQSDLIILIGSNAAWTHPVLYQRMVAAKKARPNMKVVLIDPRKTASADIADLHLPIKPAADGFLFQGLLNYLIDHGFCDQDYIENYTDGFAETAEKVAYCSIEKTAETTGLQISDLIKFFNLFASTQRVISFYSQGINQSSTGTDKCNAIINCHLATGKMGDVGTGAFSITGQPNAMGGREVGGLANQLAAHMDFAEADVDRVQRFWESPTIATQPGLKAVDLFNAIDDGKVKAVWIMATNPAVSLPDSDRVRASLDKCDFVVVSDYVENDTSKFADVKLPATSWGEKDGTVTNSERRISRQRPLREPIGEAKHDWWQLTHVARKMGFSEHFTYESPADVFREHAALSGFENSVEQRLRAFDIGLLSDISDADYESFKPLQWPVNKANPEGQERLFTDNLFFTPNRRAQFVCGEAKLNAQKVNRNTPLLLNTGRIRDQWHTMTRTGTSSKLLGHIEAPYIDISASDIERYGVQENEFACLSNDYGEYIGRIQVNSDMPVGDVFAPIHWTDEFAKKGVVSAVVSPEVDPFSGQPESKATPVKIAPLECTTWAMLALDERFLSQLDIEVFDYWYKVPSATGVRYFIGINDVSALNDMLNDMREKQLHELQFNDQLNNDTRLIWMDGDDIVLALFSNAQQDKLPSGAWIANLLDEPIKGSAHHILLGEQAPAVKMICSCFQVSENEIIEAIGEGLTSPQLLGENLKCGTNCGSCIPELKELIAEHKPNTQ